MASALEEMFGADGTLKRETPSEVVLVSRLRMALSKPENRAPMLLVTPPADAITCANQFSGRGIIEAKSPEPGGGCNVERSRMRRARH